MIEPIEIIIILLELSGLGITSYIIGKGLMHKAPVCLIGHSCDVVLQSKYSKIFGVRIVTYGFLYYLSMLILFLLKYYLTEYTELITSVFSVLVSLAAIASIMTRPMPSFRLGTANVSKRL